MPAGCGHDWVRLPPWMQLLPWLLASGAPIVSNSTPEEAVVSLLAIVLLMMSTYSASTNEIPAPSQPATLLVMMLFVTWTWYQLSRVLLPPPLVGAFGKASTSEPLTPWKRRPPPLPLPAALPWIRLALITSPGPMPSLGPTGGLVRQS